MTGSCELCKNCTSMLGKCFRTEITAAAVTVATYACIIYALAATGVCSGRSMVFLWRYYRHTMLPDACTYHDTSTTAACTTVQRWVDGGFGKGLPFPFPGNSRVTRESTCTVLVSTASVTRTRILCRLFYVCGRKSRRKSLAERKAAVK